MKYDIYISHASEDKEEVAIPLANELIKKGLKVWIDKFEISLGDSILHKIDHGLTHSKYGVVILSPSFFSKRWTQRELASLVAIEEEKGKVIIPIWHNVTKKKLLEYSPILSDKLAASTNQGIENVANQIYETVLINDNSYPNDNDCDSKSPHMFLVAGPSASGKDSILKDAFPVFQKKGIRSKICKKYSTRQLRPNENLIETTRYQNFLPSPDFEEWVKKGHLVITYSKYGNRYAFSNYDLVSNIERCLTSFAIYSDFPGFSDGMRKFEARGFIVHPILIVADPATCKSRMYRRGFSREEIETRVGELEADYAEILELDGKVKPQIKNIFETIISNIRRPYEDVVDDLIKFVFNKCGLSL